ncbi:MAG: hypothetical protein PHI98_11475 [Eubacteriales bacterium]|nr:hypothetical protein [Eubacteriales bacterium]
MSKKNKVLKALLLLAVVIAVCMYFSRTIQTITTPKVKLVQATSGRIEQKIDVSAKAYFPVKTEITLNKAKDYPITIDKVYVKTGLYVEEGDVIFTSTLNDYETKEKQLTDDYNKKAQEIIDLDIANRKSSKQSMQNDLYDQMIELQDALSEAESKARLAAAKENIDLVFDQSTWQAKAEAAGASQEVLDLIQNAVTAKASFEMARVDFFDSYENKKIKVKDEVFKYIKDRNTKVTEMQDLSDDMVALQEAKQSLGKVTAASAGYIVELDLKTGDSYTGQKSAYTIAKKDDAPILRADITDLKKEVSKNAKVEVQGEYSTYKTKVSEVINDTDGREYAEIELTEDILRSAGGMSKLMQDDGLSAKIVFRAKKNATIIPASALRTEGDSDYIFVAEYSYGGFLSSSNVKAKKTTVTVIDRSDTEVSINEDLSYQSIIDKADRTVVDGKPVMEYVE